MQRKTSILLLAWLLPALVLGWLSLAAPPLAQAASGTGQSCALQVYFGHGGESFPEAGFSLYQVAAISPQGEYVLTGRFADYPILLEGLDSSGRRALAQTLDSYVARDHLPATAVQATNPEGELTFSGLSAGLYLLIGQPYRWQGDCYIPEPVLAALPDPAQAGTNDCVVSVFCKSDVEPDPESPVDLTVRKLWQDGDWPGRPGAVSIQLVKDGTVVDTVPLCQENQWTHTWQGLEAGAKWQVAEQEVPEGYTLSIVREGTQFLVTNTRPVHPPSELPQTGLLWWPVPVLALGGSALVAAGLMSGRRRGPRDAQ